MCIEKSLRFEFEDFKLESLQSVVVLEKDIQKNPMAPILIPSKKKGVNITDPEIVRRAVLVNLINAVVIFYSVDKYLCDVFFTISKTFKIQYLDCHVCQLETVCDFFMKKFKELFLRETLLDHGITYGIFSNSGKILCESKFKKTIRTYDFSDVQRKLQTRNYRKPTEQRNLLDETMIKDLYRMHSSREVTGDFSLCVDKLSD